MKFIASTVLLVLLAAPGSVAAQSSLATIVVDESAAAADQPAPAPPTPRHTGIAAMLKGLGRDFKQLPSKENLYWAAGGGALALAVHPADEYVQQHMLNNRLADDIFKPGQVIGIVGPLAGSVVTYAWGRITDRPRISHVGMDLLQAQVVAATLTTGLKYSTRRERPDGSGATSFPSGHSAATFAFATALERHLGWKYFAPAYAAASYVAVSRLPANRHWLSDVVFGAAVGIISGRTVTSNEAQPYPVSVAPTPGGAVVVWSPARFNR